MPPLRAKAELPPRAKELERAAVYGDIFNRVVHARVFKILRARRALVHYDVERRIFNRAISSRSDFTLEF